MEPGARRMQSHGRQRETEASAPGSCARTRALAALIAIALQLAAPARSLAADVWVDAGHGGRYPGAVYAGVREADVNLSLALALRSELVRRGHRVGMTRTSDVTVERWVPTWHADPDGMRLRFCDPTCSHTAPVLDLQPRVDGANRFGADVFISIHTNASTAPSANGAETYAGSGSSTDRILSAELARLVQREIANQTGMRDRGTLAANFYVLRWSNMPAILVEAGFLSNAADRARLTSPGFRTAFAHAVADGIEAFLAKDPFRPHFTRLAGVDRYGTAAAAALASWPTGADVVFLASGGSWPDALTATPLAAAMDAPILLAAASALPTVTADALRTLAPKRLIVVGGAGVIATDTAQAAAQAAGIPGRAFERVAGEDRYETAIRIAERLGDPRGGQVFVTTGECFADAISISAYAASNQSPIVLVRRASVPACTRAYLDAHRAAIGSLAVIGGPGAVSEDVVTELASTAMTRRLAGADRYETNLVVARTFWPTGAIAPFVANGSDFPDALVAGRVAGDAGQPVLMLGRKYLATRWREYLMNEQARFNAFTVVGGPAAVPPLMDWEILKALQR